MTQLQRTSPGGLADAPPSRTTAGKLAAATVLLLASFACGGDSGNDSGTPSVALLTAGPVSDAGWYAGAYEGLQLIGDSLGFRVSHQQTRTPAEFDEAFISYAESGYGLIFGHGFEYQDAASRAGEQYPDVTFVVSSGSRSSANVVPIIFGANEATYLAGMAAGAVTESGTVGMVGGVEIPSAKGTFIAFEAGVKAMRADAVVLETFIGSWDDVSAAKEAAAAQLRQGADVLIHNVDAASFGFFQAVREAREGGREAWAFGMNRDQNDVAPDVIAGSAVINIPPVFLQAAVDWQAGTLSGPVLTGLAGGGVEFVPNPAQPGVIPAGALARIDEARVAIIAGSLEVPAIDFLEPPAGEPSSS